MYIRAMYAEASFFCKCPRVNSSVPKQEVNLAFPTIALHLLHGEKWLTVQTPTLRRWKLDSTKRCGFSTEHVP